MEIAFKINPAFSIAISFKPIAIIKPLRRNTFKTNKHQLIFRPANFCSRSVKLAI